ncbi:MAG TPA: NAD(P)-binding domain-containing protein [Longimicrobiales bacterium]|nr:NAD(P)-binding domain-containing protein [Longimicrobiales bacterium]
MDQDALLIWAIGLGLTALTAVPVLLRLKRKERATDILEEEALRYGLHEPVSLHPVVDPDRCIGISNCVSVCPEEVLGIRAGQAVAVSPARCIGHGLCERICPMEAIQLVFGTEKRGVDLPRIKGNFETNVAGLYIVGELGGMGLVANAFEQGRQCVEGIVGESENGPAGLLDLVVVGCGPAGLSSSLTALAKGLNIVTLEKEDLGGTVRTYPRKKLVMTRPVQVPGYGKLPIREIQKEELIDIWEDVAGKVGLKVTTREVVKSVDKVGPYHFRVTTERGVYESHRVILAIGRRGVPRKLGVPGEDGSSHIAYALREPEAYTGDRILVVGGGDSAVEAALALSEQPGNEVRMSYRGKAFSRIKPGNHSRLETALGAGKLEILWETSPREILPARVHLSRESGNAIEVPADQVFVFIGGELPTAFLRASGVEIETHFGAP